MRPAECGESRVVLMTLLLAVRDHDLPNDAWLAEVVRGEAESSSCYPMYLERLYWSVFSARFASTKAIAEEVGAPVTAILMMQRADQWYEIVFSIQLPCDI